MDPESIARKALVGAGVLAAAIVVVAVALGVLVATGVLTQPTVADVQTEWGPATNETTTIQTRAVVRNPNPVGLPGVLSIEYTAKLNDVVLVSATKAGVGLAPGRNGVDLSAAFDNERIAAWWPTHVNGGENSTLSIDPAVSAPLFSRDLPTRNTTVETDLLAPLETDEERTIEFANRSFLVVERQRASWGHATAETTPLSVTARLTNVHDYPVTLAGVEYVVTMNDVTLGRGTTAGNFRLEPGESGTLNVTAALDTGAFADWWPTHVRDNETSRLSVRMYGVVERNGTRKRVPLTLFERRLRFSTDLLGDGTSSVERLPTPPDDPVAMPEIERTESRWGTVTNATTEVVTRVDLSGGEGLSGLREIARITTDRRMQVNGVTVVDESTTFDRVPIGSFTYSSEMANAKVPNWWARHLNRGEVSTVETTTKTVVDVGVTRVEIPAPSPSKTVRTDLLAGIQSDDPQPLAVDGEVVLVTESTSATWGEATPERAPVTASAVVSNERRRPVTIDDIEYDVSINGITLANGTVRERYRIPAGETKTVSVTVTLNNSRMDRWWVTHVRNGETSTFEVRATATVSFAGETRTVPLEMLSDRETIETDFFE